MSEGISAVRALLRVSIAAGLLFAGWAAAAAQSAPPAAPQPPPSAAASPAADSTLVWGWSALYRDRLDVQRLSQAFPWNDDERLSARNGRLALLGDATFAQRVTLFAKGATGLRHAGDYQKDEFLLEEGHVACTLLGTALRGRLFTRERAYHVDSRLLELVSNDAPFVNGRGEGLSVEAGGDRARVSYLESMMKGAAEIDRCAGLPTFGGGGDVLRLLRLEGAWPGRSRGALMLLQTRSTGYGDAVMVGGELGARILGCDLMAELARCDEGDWDDFGKSPRPDARPDTIEGGSESSIFSRDEAFAVEADLLRQRIGGWGSVGVVPGYRFWGSRFADYAGEAVPGLRETYATAWWRPPRYDALVSADASDGSLGGVDYRRLVASARLRYRGGFEVKGSALCSEGRRCGAVLSFIDENALSRLSMTGRIDDLGRGNEFSFSAEAGANLGSSVSARSFLYLYRSETSYYRLELDFRPRERFLVTLAAGSFAPQYEELFLGGVLDFKPPRTERSVELSARVWFGRL